MGYIWLIVTILLGIIEYMTVNLTTIWWSISAIITLILSFYIKDFLTQFITFIIIGLFLLITCRPKLKKLFILNRVKTDPSDIIGQNGYVIKSINKIGEVKINGKRWEATSDSPIKQNSLIEVVDINGIKLKVKNTDKKV